MTLTLTAAPLAPLPPLILLFGLIHLKWLKWITIPVDEGRLETHFFFWITKNCVCSWGGGGGVIWMLGKGMKLTV